MQAQVYEGYFEQGNFFTTDKCAKAHCTLKPA